MRWHPEGWHSGMVLWMNPWFHISKAEDTIKNGLDDYCAFGDSEAHLENAYLINIKENADDVKQQIMEHGAAGIMYYHNDSAFGRNET